MDQVDRDEFVDMIAQAVIDKIDERAQVNRLADLVVARVLALQEEETTLKELEASATPQEELQKPTSSDTKAKGKTASASK